jgi:hypothetical protein
MSHEVTKMNGNSRIGLDGSGASRSSRSRGMDIPRVAVSSHGSGMSVISRSMSSVPTGARRRHTRALSVFAVCVVAGIIISAIALVSVGYQNAAHVQAPGQPHAVRGYIRDVGGVTPVAGANVNITNLRTGAYSNITVSGGTGYYNFDLNTLAGSWDIDDAISAVAWSTSLGLSGENVTVLTGLGANEWLNVTLGTVIVIPEFPMVILPISGMLVLFAVVSFKRRHEDT